LQFCAHRLFPATISRRALALRERENVMKLDLLTVAVALSASAPAIDAVIKGSSRLKGAASQR